MFTFNFKYHRNAQTKKKKIEALIIYSPKQPNGLEIVSKRYLSEMDVFAGIRIGSCRLRHFNLGVSKLSFM